jgi:hypothetical protein
MEPESIGRLPPAVKKAPGSLSQIPMCAIRFVNSGSLVDTSAIPDA